MTNLCWFGRRGSEAFLCHLFLISESGLWSGCSWCGLSEDSCSLCTRSSWPCLCWRTNMAVAMAAPADEAELMHMVATAAAIDDRPSLLQIPQGKWSWSAPPSWLQRHSRVPMFEKWCAAINLICILSCSWDQSFCLTDTSKRLDCLPSTSQGPCLISWANLRKSIAPPLKFRRTESNC